MKYFLTFEAAYQRPLQEQLFDAAKDGHLDLVKKLIKHRDVDPYALTGMVLDQAVRNGRVDVAKYLIDNYNFDLTKDNQYLIRIAVTRNHPEMVEYLLTLPEIDPSADRQEAVWYAKTQGYSRIFKAVIQHPNVDPGVHNNRMLLNSIESREAEELVAALIQHPKVDPSAEDDTILKWAVEKGHLKIVETLLKDKRVDPASENNWCIIRSSENPAKDSLEILKLLMADERTDASDNDNMALIAATRIAQDEIVEQLLTDERVDPNVDNFEAIKAPTIWLREYLGNQLAIPIYGKLEDYLTKDIKATIDTIQSGTSKNKLHQIYRVLELLIKDSRTKHDELIPLALDYPFILLPLLRETGEINDEEVEAYQFLKKTKVI